MWWDRAKSFETSLLGAEVNDVLDTVEAVNGIMGIKDRIHLAIDIPLDRLIKCLVRRTTYATHCGSGASTTNSHACCNIQSKAFRKIELGEYTGWDPAKSDIPTTDGRHGDSCINYSVFTDTLVWLYMFTRAGLHTSSHLKDVVVMLDKV